MKALPRAVSIDAMAASKVSGIWRRRHGVGGVLNFAIFDHLDSDGGPLGRFFEDRLRLLELIERSGFARLSSRRASLDATRDGGEPKRISGTPPYSAPRTIRLGPLVYVLPLYHPLRLYEEICMLDHLSGGRLTVGVGRGGALHRASAFWSRSRRWHRRCITRHSPC